MSPTLIHVMVMSVLSLGGYGLAMCVCLLVGMASRHAVVPSGLCGLIVVLFGTWPILRSMRARPLCLPECPHCARLPSGYFRPGGSEWPRIVLVCVDCERPMEAWMSRSVEASRRSSEMPSLRLRWPEFVGWWTAS